MSSIEAIKWSYVKDHRISDQYRIYANGTVYSEKTNVVMQSHLNYDGYLTIELQSKNGKESKKAFIHRLMAQAFIPKTPEDYKFNRNCVHFKDFDRTNIDLDNLEWVSRLELRVMTDLRHNPPSCFADYLPHIGSLLQYGYDDAKVILKILGLKSTILNRMKINNIKDHKMYVAEMSKYNF